MKTTHKCCGKLASNSWGKCFPCSRAGKIEREGKWYCGQHDPVKVAKQRAAEDAKDEQQFLEKMAKRRLESAAPALLDAAIMERDYNAMSSDDFMAKYDFPRISPDKEISILDYITGKRNDAIELATKGTK